MATRRTLMAYLALFYHFRASFGQLLANLASLQSLNPQNVYKVLCVTFMEVFFQIFHFWPF